MTLTNNLRIDNCCELHPTKFVAGVRSRLQLLHPYCQTFALGLIFWDDIGFGPDFLRTVLTRIVAVERIKRREYFLSGPRSSVVHGRVFDRLCPPSPLELAYQTTHDHTVAPADQDWHYLLQLHVLAVGTMCWLCGLRYAGSNNSSTLR